MLYSRYTASIKTDKLRMFVHFTCSPRTKWFIQMLNLQTKKAKIGGTIIQLHQLQQYCDITCFTDWLCIQVQYKPSIKTCLQHWWYRLDGQPCLISKISLYSNYLNTAMLLVEGYKVWIKFKNCHMLENFKKVKIYVKKLKVVTKNLLDF